MPHLPQDSGFWILDPGPFPGHDFMIPRKGKGGNASSGTGTKKEQNVRRLEWVEGEMVGIRGIREVGLWWIEGHTPSEGVGWRAQRHGVRVEARESRAWTVQEGG